MIIIMGAVGSGKSEQTTRLANRLHLPRLSTSQLLRDHITPQREAAMLAGDLVDDEDVISLLEPELEKLKASNQDFLLDGFPRSIPQAEWLVKKIKAGEVKFKAIIKLEVSHKAVLERLLKRGRADDKKEIIIHRLDAYENMTKPVVDYLKSHGIEVHEIDGEMPPDEVEAEIKKVLES